MVRSYTYSDNDEMLTINEGGRLVENTFDSDGRIVHQRTPRGIGADGPVVRFAPATHAVLHDIEWLVITRECRAGREALRFRD